MDEKMLEQEYRKLKQQAAPDLWSRIEMNLAEHPEREGAAVQTGAGPMTGGEKLAERQQEKEQTGSVEPMTATNAAEHADPGRRGKTLRRIPAWRPYYGMAAAAALVVVTVFANRQAGYKSMAPEMMLQETMAAAEAAPMPPEQEVAGAISETAAEMAAGSVRGNVNPEEGAAGQPDPKEAGAAGKPDQMEAGTAGRPDQMEAGASGVQNGPQENDTAMPDGGSDSKMYAEASSGSMAANGVLSYEDLELAAYQPLAVPDEAVTVPEDSAYFSEAILGDTGLLCGGTVMDVALERDEDGRAVKVVYEISLDRVYYSEDYTTGMETLTVKSPIVKTEGDQAYILYQLQKGGTYLLPLEDKDGVWELLYPFAPQIQVTGDGAYLFHSGYASLVNSEASVVIGSQEGAGDYYYDRMLLRNDDNFLSDLISLVEREAQGRK